jgi:archaellum component FlaC
MITDNILVFHINLAEDLQGNKLSEHLNKLDENALKIAAGFNKVMLEHFLTASKEKDPKDLQDILQKMEKISHLVSPTGSLSYLGENQISYVLNRLNSLNINDLSSEKISIIADEQLEKEFGGGPFDPTVALENQLSSAAFYLEQIGYPQQEIKEKLEEIRKDPKKLDSVFTLQPKEIIRVPSELQQENISSEGPSVNGQRATEDVIDGYIQQIQHDYPPERVQKVNDIMTQIKEHVKEEITEQYEKVFVQMHPDRLSRALKMLKETKRKSKRMKMLLEWFFCSHLIENIEFRVEHWQVSRAASHGQAGVYTAGINFSRYDQIVRDFPDSKFGKVVNIMRRILSKPSKNAIQKLGQDLIATTGFDEHLYFTD